MPKSIVLTARKFLFGFDSISQSAQAWLELVAHVIPREIREECRSSGLFDFDGTLKWGSFWEYLGRQRCQEVESDAGQKILFRSHDEALDFIAANQDVIELRRIEARGRRRRVTNGNT